MHQKKKSLFVLCLVLLLVDQTANRKEKEKNRIRFFFVPSKH